MSEAGPVVANVEALAAALAPGARLLGLDPGTKTLGLAISDSAFSIASSLGTWKRGKFTEDVAKLAELAAERGVGGIVIGLPVNMDGSEGPRAQSARALAANLAQRLSLPVVLWDERLSTAAVERFLVDEADVSRRRRAEVVDGLAAAWILQGVLDRLRALRAGR
ncbi:MAG: Holliday junction resolvase RuvX [Alphaproteobacteria bacterium]|nr:Holliday junction resolvase RuvX [Alphaproteobacteria bacterium]